MVDDLEDCWADLRPKGLTWVLSTHKIDLDALMRLITNETILDLTQSTLNKDPFASVVPGPRPPITVELLSELIGTGIRIFMTKWRKNLSGQSLIGLIEFVLASPNTTLQELEGFLRALPVSVLGRNIPTSGGYVSGTHGLVAVEYLRRQGGVDYLLGREGTRIWFELHDIKRDVTVRYFLDEPFQLPAD